MELNQQIKIVGPEGGVYRLAEAMHVFDHDRLLGTVDPVLVSDDLSEVHLEHFHPSEFVLAADFNIGGLVFLEICAFLCHKFDSVGVISFVLSRPFPGLGPGTKQALLRADLMTRIGAADIQIGPKPDRLPGHFAVSGIWRYGDQTVAALMDVLEDERRKYAEWKTRSKLTLLGRLRNALLRQRER
ncbi:MULTISPECIES: hypothetical protein [unclassified Variovorax]|uniref:hypothetical protein n=1 Tax=unclassified Variovorax TaxID=663243 RepID=UPI00076D46C4|nr:MULTISPECIES: hypothetical protein [unclassified Variovorax]KWT70822.1 hypothetical protein APY03_6578 [Variovorax sp. WDL1]PNG49189.1 hypothetical protein CHC06_06426 [Variovorax sp. B2]PNG49574.1 hypothetical protein CHC07_06483 [Variovorax sp. B4]VTV18764.1 hypothetical protein WDL1P2_00414 [Variovorax sp. WDL1]